MKIEEIEKLRKQITQGDWKPYFRNGMFYIICNDVLIMEECCTFKAGNDFALAASSPKMAEMLIKLKNFKVTDEFVVKACNYNEKYYGGESNEDAQEIITQLIKELENED